jgi:hypothetical protein
MEPKTVPKSALACPMYHARKQIEDPKTPTGPPGETSAPFLVAPFIPGGAGFIGLDLSECGNISVEVSYQLNILSRAETENMRSRFLPVLGIFAGGLVYTVIPRGALAYWS